jgi:formylmethanofuran dehydrogenase subunit D
LRLAKTSGIAVIHVQDMKELESRSGMNIKRKYGHVAVECKAQQ